MDLQTVVDVVPCTGRSQQYGHKANSTALSASPRTHLGAPIASLQFSPVVRGRRVRRPGASESFIAQSKRAIDTFNKQRHEQIEQLDMWLFAYLYEHNSRRLTETELHSETPGNLLDRLSILTLKVYYMGREAERQDATVVHRQTCRQHLAMLAEQRDDIYGCLCRLCLDLWSGR
jgi:hypothetical protein